MLDTTHTHHLGLTIPRATLLPALRRTAMVIARRTTVPVLAHVRLTAADGVLTIAATDMDLHLSERLPAEGPAMDLTVSAPTLLGLISRIPAGETIVLAAEGEERLRITAGRLTARLPTGHACDFPDGTPGELPHRFEIGADMLRGLLERTRHAVSTEETRYYLNGIALQIREGRLTAISTDGHRLAIVSTSAPTGAEGMPDVILLRAALGPLLTMLGRSGEAVTVEASHTRMRFTLGAATLTTRTIHGTFPDYPRVIPAGNPHVATINPDAMLATLARVASIGEGLHRSVKLTFGQGLTLQHDIPEVGMAEEALAAGDITYRGPAIEIGFQARYLRDALQQFGGAAEMAMLDRFSPTVITDTADPHARYVLMPMRI